MARGNESKAAMKASYACKQYEITASVKPKQMTSTTFTQQKPAETKKDYGAWGPVFKDKKTFLEMHHC